MGLIVSGINHTTAPIEIRERLSFDEELARRANHQLLEKGILQEAAILSTCNRTEIYGAIDDLSVLNGQISHFISEIKLAGNALPETLFYHKNERESIRHLFRVAAGLDSMVVGEAQILGQVKQAYGQATEAGSTGIKLNKLFHHAFRVGKRVRTETRIGQGAVSVASVSVDLAKKIYGDLAGKRLMLIGAGEMAQCILAQLRNYGAKEIFIINRTKLKAEVLADNYGATVIPFDEMEKALAMADMVITSTAAKQAVLTPDIIKKIMAQRKNRPLFLVDISVPRNIQPDVKEMYNVYLYNIDDLQSIVKQNFGNREKEIPKAEQIVAEEVEQFMEWYQSLPSIYTIQQIQEHFEAVRRMEIKRSRKFFKEEDWEQMDKFSKSLMKKFLHSPIMRLKSCPETGNLCERCTVKEVFGLENE